MTFLWEVACPDIIEHLLADLAMQPANTVDLLTGVAGESTHAELFSVIFWVRTSHTHELVPCDTKSLRIATHILTEEAFLEIIVTCRNRSMDSIESTGTYQLEGLVERQSLFDIVTQTLQITQSSMTLVTMVYILLNAQLLQQ